MAECMMLLSARDRWCNEKLEFVCAVVEGVDRASLRAQLESCETEEDAEGLMHSLLWLQDCHNAQMAAFHYDEEPQQSLQSQPDDAATEEPNLLSVFDGLDLTEDDNDLRNDPTHDPQLQFVRVGQQEGQQQNDAPVTQILLTQQQITTPRQYPRLPLHDPDYPEVWGECEDLNEYLEDENHSLLYPHNPNNPLQLLQERHEDVPQEEDEEEEEKGAVAAVPPAAAKDITAAEDITAHTKPAASKEEDTANDQLVAQLLADEEEEQRVGEETTGDEQLARELAEELAQEEAEELAQEEAEEEKAATDVAILMNMFPDAEPEYLQERSVEVKGEEEAFGELVEELLQLKTTEQRMSGYLKRQKTHSSNSPEEDIPAPLFDPSKDVTANELHECFICYEEEVLEKNMATCNAYTNYHKFCIDCIRKHVAAQIGQGHSTFKCMNGYCKYEFSWRTLKRVMEPVVFHKIQERKQQDEIIRAGIENLTACPFCNFMIIMPNEDDKVLDCLNPECLKESCRLCKEVSHVPLRCEEVERETQKDARVVLENQMAEAMIRECPYCKKRFIKEAGCNKMVCSCGTAMCYLCKIVITNDYHHFEKQGIVSDKCPLWSSSSELHTSEVRAAALRGKQELDPTIQLVYDPTVDIL